MSSHGGSRHRRSGAFAFDNLSEEDRDRQQFLSLGKQPDVLYKQGKCISCEIPLFGKEPKARSLCGSCRADMLNGAVTTQHRQDAR